MAYVTAAIAKSDWLQIAAADTTHDAMIERFILAAVSEIDAILGQPIEAVDTDVYFSGNGTAMHPLFYTVPVTLTTLSYRNTPLESWTAATATEYGVYTDGITKLYHSDGLTYPLYKAAMTIGYATADVPDEIAICAYELVKEMFNETPHGSYDRFGVGAITQTDAGISISKVLVRMRPIVEQRLAQYRRITI